MAGPKHIAGTAGRVELQLKPGNRFELLQYSLPTEGTFEFRGDKIYLKAQTSMGRPVLGSGEGIYLVRVGDNWELHDPLGPVPDPVLLTKKAEPDIKR